MKTQTAPPLKKILIILFILQVLWPQLATAQSVLTRINKITSHDTVELYCSFDSIPRYRSNMRGKRVDFILDDTVLTKDFRFFEADDKIVKILSLHKNNKTILSFFFRYPPQQFVVTANSSQGKVTVKILLGNPYSSALPKFSAKLSGLTILERTTKDFSNPMIASPYAADWRSFFRLYETEVSLTLPVQFSVLPFPAMAYLLPDTTQNKKLLNKEIYELASQRLWGDILPILLRQITAEKDPEIKKKLALTYGDVLSRDDNFVDAYKQFYLLSNEYQEEAIGVFARYLLILLRARFEDPYIADFQLRSMQNSIPPKNPLTPYFIITQLETSLATGQYQRMKTLLARDDIAFPRGTALIKELRQADYWYGTGKSIMAYIGYQLLETNKLLRDKIFSLNGYCDTLYQQRQFPEAARCYNELSGHITDKETLGLITYRKYMAKLNYSPPREMVNAFARIESTFPETEAGFRGALKKTDLLYLTRPDWSEEALLAYKTLAATANTRSAREEASFKEALIYRLMNENIKSVTRTMLFLRNFRKGALHQSGQALLIELFPLVIHEYVAKKMYMKALVLAKQNRKLFLNNWVDIALLADIASSYNSIGIYNEAAKLYLYLITLSSEDQKERYYLPLIKASYDHRAFDIVEDYADQYSFRYPKGPYSSEILEIRIKSLVAEDRFKEAIDLLPDPLPASEDFSLLAARLFFLHNNYGKVIATLEGALPISAKKMARTNFMLAESFYQLGLFDKAAPVFASIPSESEHHDQALYRRAQLLQLAGNIPGSLKIYTELVETGKNPLWIKLAQKELELNQIL